MMNRFLPGALVVIAICAWGCSNGDVGPEPYPELPQEEGADQPDFGSPPAEPGSGDGGMRGGQSPDRPPRGEQSEMPEDPAPLPGGQSPADPPAGGASDAP